jgi:hypothetical protein
MKVREQLRECQPTSSFQKITFGLWSSSENHGATAAILRECTEYDNWWNITQQLLMMDVINKSRFGNYQNVLQDMLHTTGNTQRIHDVKYLGVVLCNKSNSINFCKKKNWRTRSVQTSRTRILIQDETQKLSLWSDWCRIRETVALLWSPLEEVLGKLENWLLTPRLLPPSVNTITLSAYNICLSLNTRRNGVWQYSRRMESINKGPQ